MRTLILSILIAGIISSSLIAQVAGVNNLNPLSGKWIATVEGGASFAETDFRKSAVSIYSRIMGEYFFETQNPGIFGLRAFGGFGFLQGSGGVANFLDPVTGLEIDKFKSTIAILGAGINYTWAATDEIFPYAYLGASYLFFDPRDKNGDRLPNNELKKYSRQEPSLQGELGIRFLVDENISLNLNGAVNYVNIDKLDDIKTGRDNDIFFTFLGGVSFSFGGVKDSDKDGISDESDVCSETPQGVKVDEFGCPLDTDADGVPDYLDRCQQTRSNIIVDADGCPLDSDLDGIPDYTDQCVNTPQIVPVDARGCPFDKDDDGVPDYKDKCPDTPSGIEVDKFGCPLKSQEKVLPEITKMVLSGEVNFAIGKSRLMPDAGIMLDKMIKVLKDNPETRWRITGHTDNTGAYQTNKKLSLERAWAVADYLIKYGIESNRLTVEGLGPDYPISDNSTVSGRAQNRRVSIEFSDGEASRDSYPRTYVPSDYNSSIERNVGNMIFTDGNLYCYQISSWRSRSKAERELSRLNAAGENAFIVEVNNISGLEGTWYRVRVGYFNSLQEARNSKARVK
jgi:OOP family OmpA-OmpF porin